MQYFCFLLKHLTLTHKSPMKKPRSCHFKISDFPTGISDIFPDYAIVSSFLARYSLGVHPTSFLKKRRKCCGYWKPLHVVVQFLARDKLAFVETHAVVEQDLNVRVRGLSFPCSPKHSARPSGLCKETFTAALSLENALEDMPTSVTVIFL